MVHFKLDSEFATIVKYIEDFDTFCKGNLIQNEDKIKILDAKEPHICFSLRNLLLYYPGGISIDRDGKRLFISDSNHHRVIISDLDGKVLDCIGSSPGFEDGEFDSTKLLRPAASYYCVSQNCLYIVDSENHAIRRADIATRVTETVFPLSIKKRSGIWSWILDKLGMTEETSPKCEETDSELVSFPWHMLKLEENDFILINRSFETSWIVNLSTGEIKETVKGDQNIIEICGDLMKERTSLLKEIWDSELSQRLNNVLSLHGCPYAGLVSSVVSIENYIIICDAVGQNILKYTRESMAISHLQLSELGNLGLPYWLICPLERVLMSDFSISQENEQMRNFSLLPGRCDIKVNIDIPKGTVLSEPLRNGCIWRRTRGSAVEISESNDAFPSYEKIGVAQQWFDELDNLAFSNSVEPVLPREEQCQVTDFHDEDTVRFDCAVNISPGTAEILVSGVLYLRLKELRDGTRKERIARALMVLDLEEGRNNNNNKNVDGFGGGAAEFLLNKYVDEEEDRRLHGVVFLKPFHLRLKLRCADHPAAVTNKETISTDSVLEVKFSLV